MTSTGAVPTGWLRIAAFGALVLLPIAEIVVLIQVTQRIGWWTLAILLLGVVVGGWLIRREGIRSWRALDEAARSGTAPTRSALNSVLTLAGGLALIIPGLITDVVGLVLLLPVTRPLVRRLLSRYLDRRFGRLREQLDLLRARGAGSVIEGEVVESTSAETEQTAYGDRRTPPRLNP